MDEALSALPPDTDVLQAGSGVPRKDFARWHVYYLASESRSQSLADCDGRHQAGFWRNSQDRLKSISTASSLASGRRSQRTLTIRNLGKPEIKAPETFWSANVILDGKVYQRVAQSPWSGTGIIAPGSAYEGSVRLSEHEFGIKPAVLGPGEHKLAMNIGDETSKEVTFTMWPKSRRCR